MPRLVSLASALAPILLALPVAAGELVNNTKENVAVQSGTRDAQTGSFEWSAAVVIPPGLAATFANDQWYRYDTLIGDTTETWSLPGSFQQTPNVAAYYFFLYGKEVRTSTTP